MVPGGVIYKVDHVTELEVQSVKRLEPVFFQHIVFHLVQTDVEIAKRSDVKDANRCVSRIEDGTFGVVTNVQPNNISVNQNLQGSNSMCQEQNQLYDRLTT